MKILITGSSGLVGKAISAYYVDKGHEVLQLQRQNPKASPYWDIEKQIIILEKDEQIDIVIHLAGESIAEGRWNKNKKSRILSSRIDGTKLLSKYFSKIKNKPKVFISCSAIGFYGDRQEEILTEKSKKGDGFLSDVADKWEKATHAASDSGIRVVHMRLGMVLSKQGGALKKMLLPFKMSLGGTIGDGAQFVSWISIKDLTHAINHIVENEALRGAVNIVTPNPVTNDEFTKTLGKVLHRPTFLPLPKFLTKLIFGQMGEELLLSSTKVEPGQLTITGFKFQYPELEMALKHSLNHKTT